MLYSVMVGIPAVRKGIVAKINSRSPIVFNSAMHVHPGSCAALGYLCFVQSKAATGIRLRIALGGGAAISRDTQNFLTTALVME